MKKLLFFWNELKASFWFIPVLLILLGILLAVGLVYLDSLISIDQNGILRFFFVQNLDSARSILTTISSAMIGVAGTVFSVTLVVLTLAASQFGPRLIKNFMDIRLNQVVLGAYIATFLFCLLVLSSIKDQEDYVFIPSISILFAVFATIANIVLLIFFIHKIAISIQADKVVSDISVFISKQVQTLFPEKMGDDPEEEPEFDLDQTINQYSKSFSLKSPKSGYLQYVDSAALMESAEEKNIMMNLYYRPGSYLVIGMELAKIYSQKELEKDDLEQLIDHFVIGKTKTAQQDLEHSIHQMVEIAVRALSPGINDPYTAISCIDNLSTTMSYLTQSRLPSKYRYDSNQTLRIIADNLGFEGMMDAAFNQIRQFAGAIPAVLIRMMEAFITINEFAKKKTHQEAIIKHAEMVLRVGRETIKEKHDLKDLEERAEKILSLTKK
ncbi:DUF2254 domain-containing protein [Algoriphagus hitonicola]|uniref:Uncharacterized membrane protein n=1 Tax=Algoriphagus hitonicola TaxID=435880 RepID=A0A1I2P8M9_9BACT|nr:DUF2254 domain-containing protein [Algoriphagus hitonicola]SFG10307.1 Uncharacterized membrane protein [Algoriphagus hitonicola]